MDPETNAPTIDSTSNADTAAVAEQPASTASTPDIQALLEAERQKAHDAAYAKARREFEAKAKGNPPKKQNPSEQPAPQSQGLDESVIEAMMSRQSAFDRAAVRSGLSDDQIGVLQTLFKVERPENVSEWVTAKARIFGVASNTPKPNQQPAPNAASSQMPVNQVPSVAPSTHVPSESADEVSRWSEAQWLAYIKAKGGDVGNPYHWKNTRIHREIAKRFEQEAATKRIIKT